MRFFAGLVFAAAVVSQAAAKEYVSGKAFDRFVTIWLENTDYDSSYNPNFPSSGTLLTSLPEAAGDRPSSRPSRSRS
jgi:hypothetical protein